MPSELVLPPDAEIEELRITVPAASLMMWTPTACVPCALHSVLVSIEAPGERFSSTAAPIPMVEDPTRPTMPSVGVVAQSVVQRPVVASMSVQFSWIVGFEAIERTP